MTYWDFLEDTFTNFRNSAPRIFNAPAFDTWLKEVGEFLASIDDKKTQGYWLDQYSSLIVIKYGGIHEQLAMWTIQHAMTMAMLQRSRS